ncbi:MAG: hypothetical protein SV253_09050 [Halobacteria archaeon]|nr:hypothetical protein [Halobacteria archaeon]
MTDIRRLSPGDDVDDEYEETEVGEAWNPSYECRVPSCGSPIHQMARFETPDGTRVEGFVCTRHYHDVEAWKNHSKKPTWIKEVDP